MPEYRRWRNPGGVYFFTVKLHRSKRDHLVKHIDVLRESMDHFREAYPFTIDAAVVLPDHLHCIWKLPENDADFSTRWRLIKRRFSRQIDAMAGGKITRNHRGELAVWQRRFWEHLIRDQKDYNNHVDYIHYNPVKHGYVENPVDWPHSSLHRWIEKGVLEKDWGCTGWETSLDREYGD